MRLPRLVCATLLFWAWLGNAGGLRPNDSDPPTKAVVSPPAAAAPAATGSHDPKAEPPLVEIRLFLVELRGDPKRALKEARFSAVGRSEGRPREGELLETGPGSLESLKQNAESLDVLCAPRITTTLGQTSTIEISTGPVQLPYFVRTGAKTFELKESAADAQLGIRIQLVVQSVAGQDDKLSVSPIKISMTTLDGRESIAGVDLDIGKPIVSTRTLETSMTVVNGAEPSGIVLPAPAGRQPVLFVGVQRVREPRLGEILPDPGAMIPIHPKSPKALP
jgi:hypothetical protein